MNATASLLQELAQSLGLESLEADADGSASVTFDDAVTVEFRPDADGAGLVLFSALDQLPPERLAAVAPRLLQANLFWQDTGGATLGVSSTGLAILCQRAALAELDLPGLRNLLEKFINTAQVWQHYLENTDAAPAEAPAAATATAASLRA